MFDIYISILHPIPTFYTCTYVLALYLFCLVFISMYLDPIGEEFKDEDDAVLSTPYTVGDVDASIAQ